MNRGHSRFAPLLLFLLFAGAVGSGRRLSAQAPSAAEQAVADAMERLDRGDYLQAIDRLERLAAGAQGGRDADIARQTWLQARPMIGGYVPPPPIDLRQPGLPDAEAARLRRAKPEDALETIAAAAARARIVILNEAHQSPRDRAFGLAVARRLRPLGYDALAAEAFNNDPHSIGRLARDRFPSLMSGTYLKDPVFADFVRQALTLGYAPVAYEQTHDQRVKGPPGIPGREQAEADNLAAYLAAHPGRKLLVYVGFSHVAEAPLEEGDGPAEWMAARLKKLTGLDPVTIEQVSLAEDSPSRGLREAYSRLSAPLRRSAIFRLDGRPLVIGPYAGAVDFQVVHPPTRLKGGRPDWLAALGRRPVAVPAALMPTAGRRLVQAFLAAEPADAIPIDQVLVQAGKPPPKLMLPKGRIRFAHQDPEPRPTP
jgi:hypothetical protein